MGPISMLFPNPAVKILEQRLWDAARKRYLQEHPSDRNDDAKTIMRRTRTAYKDSVAANLEQADHKIRAKWAQFKHAMMPEVQSSLLTLFRMSDLDWYSVEAGTACSPEVIAVPYQLLKHTTTALLSQHLRKQIGFEELDNETLQALSSYAADEKFREMLEELRSHYEPIRIGEKRTRFVVAEIVERDAYFLGEDQHHSLIDMVILCSTGGAEESRKNQKAAAKKWFHQGRQNRTDNRRFSGDGWEISAEELKSWATGA
jgi:hypothetical protein